MSVWVGIKVPVLILRNKGFFFLVSSGKVRVFSNGISVLCLFYFSAVGMVLADEVNNPRLSVVCEQMKGEIKKAYTISCRQST